MAFEQIGRSFSPAESEIADIRRKAEAEGADPDAAEAAYRAKLEKAGAQASAGAAEKEHESAMRSLESALAASWEKLTPEERKRLADRYFAD